MLVPRGGKSKTCIVVYELRVVQLTLKGGKRYLNAPIVEGRSTAHFTVQNTELALCKCLSQIYFF